MDYLENKTRLIPKEPYFITVKTSENFPSELKVASLMFIQEMYTYSWKQGGTSNKTLVSNVRTSQSKDFDQILKISTGSFKTSRFYQDPRLAFSDAEKIKRLWISANLVERKNSHTLVYSHEDFGKEEVLGYVSLLDFSNFVTIDLICVATEYRGKGIGGALLDSAILYAEKKGVGLQVGTQSTNSSNRLYLKKGFEIISKTYVGHDIIFEPWGTPNAR